MKNNLKENKTKKKWERPTINTLSFGETHSGSTTGLAEGGIYIS